LDEAVRAVQNEFLPTVSKIPGFLEYELIDGGDRLATISTFESKEGAEESTRRSAQFLKERPKLAAAITDRQITEGESKVHKAAEGLVGAA
jgi:hypothetical protein